MRVVILIILNLVKTDILGVVVFPRASLGRIGDIF